MAIVKGFRESISYVPDPAMKISKIVVFFLCEPLSAEVKCSLKEIETFRWLSFEDALKRLTHKNSVNLLKKADAFLKESGLS